MGYHDVRLPETFSTGSLFGPGFKTSIVELDSGEEARIQRGHLSGRRYYSLERGISSLDDLNVLYEFFLARQGALNSFRLLDWIDYSTAATRTNHRPGDTAPAFGDQELVLVDGKTYQLVTRYVSGSQTVVRTIHKPVSGTVLVGDNGVLVADSNYTVDYQTGRVTFNSGYTINGTVTGGCEFDTVVRFDEATDQAMMIAIAALDTGNLPEIRCVEDIQPVTVTQDFPYGGAKNHGAVAGASTTILSVLDGRLQVFGPTDVNGHVVQLPDPTLFPTGGPYFHLHNEGTKTMVLKDHTGATLVATWAVDSGYVISLGLTAASTPLKAWFIT